MKLSTLLQLSLALSALVLAAPARAQDPAPTPKPEKGAEKDAAKKADKKDKAPVYDEKAVGTEQIAAALVKAKRENRRVLIQWGANWCGWCVALSDLSKSNADIRKELLYEYDVVKIDIGKWNKHMDLATKYGADLMKTGVPYLTVLDADGKVLANQNTGDLELADKKLLSHDPVKVVEFLKGHEAPHLDAQPVYDAALATAKKEGKRVFVHFGAPWCGWCHKLEDWMARPEIESVLAKDFVLVKIDQDRMPGGAEMLARLRSDKEGGIPWFAFLDANGTMLVESVMGKGTIGFPAKEDEIAFFRGMLEKVRVNISPEEIAMLADSLIPPKKPAPEKPAEKPAPGS